MMIKKFLGSIALAFAATAALAETTTPETTESSIGPAMAEENVLMLAGIRVGNPFDPSTWWEGSDSHSHEHEPIAVNFADPDFWMGFVDPETHSRNHATFTDPKTWAEFLKPEFYTQMANMDVWMKWMDLETYGAFADPQTYAYWLQPGAYEHLFSVEHYEQLAELDNYKVIADTALETLGFDAYFDTIVE